MDTPTSAWTQHRLGERAASWFATSVDPIVWIDEHMRFVYANAAFSESGCANTTDLIGRSLVEVRPLGNATDDLVRVVIETGRERTRTEAEFTWQRPDGCWNTCSVSVRADLDEADQVIGYLIVVRDITSQRVAEQAARDREAEFRTLADNSPDNIIRYGLDGRASYCNRAIEGRVNVRVSDVLGRTPLEAAPPGSSGVDEYERQILRAIRSGAPGCVDLVVRDPGGVEHTHSALIRAERDSAGLITGAIAIGRDVSDLVRARHAVADKEREFRSLAENATDSIGRWDVTGRLLYANPALASAMGSSSDVQLARRRSDLPAGPFDAVGAAICRVIALDRAEVVEHRFAHPEVGVERVHEIRLLPEHDDNGCLLSVLGVGRDVTDEVSHREDLERLARTDSLTGVANRNLLYERSPALLDEARVHGWQIGVMLLDLDGFKHVNDRFGHRAGDDLLRIVSARLATCVRERDLLVRIGGDEFVLVASRIESRSAMVALAERVRLALTEIDGVGGGRFGRVDASIGIVMFPEDGDTMDALLAHADLAMYEAKRNGRGRVEHFRPELGSALDRRVAIEQALMGGDFATEFELHLQPIYELRDGTTIVGAEALARWTHPTLGSVAPDEFIPVAEECGRIVQLGRWALDTAAEIAARCNRGRTSPLRIAVNVSTRQFALDDVASALRHALGRSGCEPSWLTLEITESLLLEDCESVQAAIDDVRSLGVAVAIDDFGMGYSALHYLARFRVDHLKIDRAFVDGIGHSDRRAELVRAFVALATALDLDVVAEGVETAEQLRFLRDIGCGYGQGFLLARPMPVVAFEALLLSHDGISGVVA